jgi:hypothetical protein
MRMFLGFGLWAIVSCDHTPFDPDNTTFPSWGTSSPTNTQTTTPSSTEPTQTTGTGTSTSTSTSTSSSSSTAQGLALGEEIRCRDPLLRQTSGYYERIELPIEEEISSYLLGVGGGLIMGDFTGNGKLELFTPSETTYQFWVQQDDGTWTDEKDRIPDTDLTMSVGGTVVDVDADGDFDIFVQRFVGTHVLLENDGTGHFNDITASTGLDAFDYHSQSSSWGDIDADGDLDLVVGNYSDVEDTLAAPIPETLEPSELWRNNGDGTFEDVSSMLPVDVQEGYVFQTGFYDLTMDGYPELFFIHDYGENTWESRILTNTNGVFTVDYGSDFDPNYSGMCLGFGDVNGDLLPDILQTSWRDLSLHLGSPSSLAENGISYAIEWAPALGLMLQYDALGQDFGWGCELQDLDNDTDIDAPMVMGLWRVDVPLQYDSVFVQNADGIFTDLAATDEWDMADTGGGRGMLTVDVNRDGWLDVVKKQIDGPTLIHQSRCGEEAWLEVDLQQPGPNLHAIGAKVVLTEGDEQWVRWVHSGSSSLYAGGPPTVHFGLDEIDAIDQIEVFWPDLSSSLYKDVPTRRFVTITRADTEASP